MTTRPVPPPPPSRQRATRAPSATSPSAARAPRTGCWASPSPSPRPLARLRGADLRVPVGRAETADWLRGPPAPPSRPAGDCAARRRRWPEGSPDLRRHRRQPDPHPVREPDPPLPAGLSGRADPRRLPHGCVRQLQRHRLGDRGRHRHLLLDARLGFRREDPPAHHNPPAAPEQAEGHRRRHRGHQQRLRHRLGSVDPGRQNTVTPPTTRRHGFNQILELLRRASSL